MDERLKKALDFSNYRLSLHNQKQTILNKLEDKLIIYENNGKFTANKETISYITSLIGHDTTKNQETFIILDDLNKPIKILDIGKFLEKLIDTHTVAINEYYIEYEKISRSRNIKKLLNLEENE